MEVPSTRATLLERLRCGDDANAWHEFHGRYAELVFAFARRWGMQAADCEDVVQESFARLARRLPGFRYDPGRGRFRGYLKATVTSVIVSRWRQVGRAGGVQPLEAVREPPDRDRLDEAWENEWRRHHVRLAMRRIRSEFSDRDLAVFDRYALRGEAARETAEALGRSLEQVYQVKSRIMRRVQGLIDEQIATEV